MRFFTGLVLVALAAASAEGQITYTWIGGSSAWTTSANWDPARTAPAQSDILQFNDGSTVTITSVPTQTIGYLLVSASTSVTLEADVAGAVLTVAGSGQVLYIALGSSLNVSGSNPLSISIGSGATATIRGAMTFDGGAHRLLASDAGSVTFTSGSVLTQGSGCSGNIFGSTGTANVVIFSNGSTFVSQDGGNPFGFSQPKSKVAFQSGSLYRHEQTGPPSCSGRTYADFELNLSSGTATGSGSGALTIENLTVTAGTLKLGMTGEFGLKGNISVVSGAALDFDPSSAATLTLNGSSTQNISNSGTLSFDPNETVMMNNSNGVRLASDITISGALAMSSGNITTNGHTLTLGSTSEGTLSYTSGVIIGNFARYISGTNAMLFPVGTASNYHPLTITYTTAPTTAGVVTVSNTVPDLNGSDLPSALSDGGYPVTRRSNQYWTLTQTSAAGGVYNLSVDGDGQSGIGTPSELRVIHSNEGSSFDLKGTHSPGTGSTANRTAIDGSVSGRFYLAGNLTDNPLPVTMKSISAIVDAGQIHITISTATELETTGFNIYRSQSKDGPFELISDYKSNVALRGLGTSMTGAIYTFVDTKVTKGKTYYYKFESVSTSGIAEEVGGIIEVQVPLPKEYMLSQNYPNPFNPSTHIKYHLATSSHVTLQVYDMIGRSVATLVDDRQCAGEYEVSFDGSRFPSGVYSYRFNAVDKDGKMFVRTQRMVLMK